MATLWLSPESQDEAGNRDSIFMAALTTFHKNECEFAKRIACRVSCTYRCRRSRMETRSPVLKNLSGGLDTSGV